MSQETVVGLLDLVRGDEALRVELARLTALEDLEAAIAPLGFTLLERSAPDESDGRRPRWHLVGGNRSDVPRHDGLLSDQAHVFRHD